MSYFKELKDRMIRSTLGNDFSGVLELHEYLNDHGAINFENKKLPDGTLLARSTNFAIGSIITTGKDPEELDRNIKDAILTAFDIPSSYAKEASIEKVGAGEKYALA